MMQNPFNRATSTLSLILILLVFISCKNEPVNQTETSADSEDAALSELNELIGNDKDNDELLFQRANLYHEKEAYDEALDDIFAAQKIDSVKAEYYHLLADVYLDYYKSFEALNTMKKVVSLHPQRIPSLLKYAEFQYILKQYNESIITLNDVLAFDRLEPEAFFMLGMNFRALGDMERAKNSFQTAVENNPELIDGWMMLGNLHMNEDDPLALQFYDNALIVAPDNIEAMHGKAFYYQNHDNIPKAIEIYKKINVVDPQYPDAYLNTGLLYLELDSLQQAHEQFDILVKTDITNPIAYFYRAYIYEQIGELEKAKTDYEQALRLSPEFEEAKNALELLATAKDQE